MDEIGIEDGIRWVRSRDTQEVMYIDWGPEVKADVAAFNAQVCAHPARSVMRVAVANGAIQVRRCCNVCGARVGNPEKQTDQAWVAALPLQSPYVDAVYEAARKEERYQLYLKHALRQHSAQGQRSDFYNRHLLSPEWESTRQKVIRRCGNVCEGCGDREVQHVHHMTYEHLGNEFLFELMGLCLPCHDRVHGHPERKIR